MLRTFGHQGRPQRCSRDPNQIRNMRTCAGVSQLPPVLEFQATPFCSECSSLVRKWLTISLLSQLRPCCDTSPPSSGESFPHEPKCSPRLKLENHVSHPLGMGGLVS